MRQETLWTNAKGHIRQMTAPLARDQNGSADMQLYHWLREKKATCTKPQTLSPLDMPHA